MHTRATGHADISEFSLHNSSLGDDVASDEVRVCPIIDDALDRDSGGLAALSIQPSQVDEAFGEAVDQHVAELFNL